MNNQGQSVDLPQIISAFKRITINKVKENIKNQNVIINLNSNVRGVTGLNVVGVADSTNVFDEFNSFLQSKDIFLDLPQN